MPDYAAELAELMPETTTLPRQGVGINVRRLFKLRGPAMLLVFLAIFVPAAAAVWFLIPLYYVASADLEFSAQPTGILSSEGRELAGGAYASFVNTQLKLITGYPIAKRVVENPDVSDQPTIANAQYPIATLMERLESSQEYESEVVSITYYDKNRDAALAILNTVVAEYMNYLNEQERDKGGVRSSALREKEEQLQKELDGLLQQASQMRQSLGVPMGQEPGTDALETEALRENLAKAEADLSAAESQARLAKVKLGQAEEAAERLEKDPGKRVYIEGVEEQVIAHPAVTIVTEQLATLQQELAVMEDKYVSDEPRLQVRRSERDALQAELNKTRSEVRREALQLVLAQARATLADAEAAVTEAQSRRDRFQEQIDAYRTESVELSKGVAEIVYVEQRADDVRTRLDQVRDQLFRIDVESNAPARVEPLGEAVAGDNPSYEERIKGWLLAFLVAGVVSVVFGIGWETIDQRVRSGEDIRFVTEAPIIGQVPHASEDRLPGGVNPATIAGAHSASATADEFRRVAGRILGAGGRGEVRTCVVSSPARGDGKTTLACNLAIVLAQAERRVLLIDLDSRNPGVERAFGIRPGPGLAEILNGEPMTHDPDRATEFENLFVLGPGMRARDLPERLASREMSDFLEGAQELFDHIIIDTPAALLMSETRLVAPLADGVVLVVGSGVSTFGMLRRAIAITRDSGGRVLGVVINGLRQAPLGYLKHNIDAYYAGEGARFAGAGRGIGRRRGAPPSVVLVHDDESR